MEKQYTVDPNATSIQVVGKIDTTKINRLLGLNLPDVEVFMYPGAIKHVKKNHPGIFENFHQFIPDILSNPDYVGNNPKEPNSVELYKRVSMDLLLAVKLDPTGYLYLSSMYDLHNANHKIQKRLKSGRIVAF